MTARDLIVSAINVVAVACFEVGRALMSAGIALGSSRTLPDHLPSWVDDGSAPL